MILMYLGSLGLLLFGWNQLWKSYQDLTATVHTSLLERNAKDTHLLLFRSIFLNLTMASAKANIQDGILSWNLGIKKRRESVLRFCLSALGWFFPLIVATFYLGLSGYLVLGIAVLGFFTFIQKRTPKSLWSAFSGLGIFLLGAEISLRQAPVLINYLGTGDFAFFLADGRFGAVLSLLLMGVILSFVLSIEMWSLVVALSLVVANVISLNGAVALIVGEILSLPILTVWRTRSLAATQKKTVLIVSFASIAGSFLGFMVAGELRSIWQLGFSTDFSAFQGKILQVVFLTSVVLVFQILTLMIVGHFQAIETEREGSENVGYLDATWKSDLSPELRKWFEGRVSQRLHEIRYHIQGLESLPDGKVPMPIQRRLLSEEKQLSDFVQGS